MARPRPTTAALLVVAAFSRHLDALTWARARLEAKYGPVAMASEPFVFDQTSYYESSMGAVLSKVLWSFADLIDPARLPDIKHDTNALEQELADSGRYPDARPVNLDPGYLVMGKFLLATTKDQAHRVYLRDGIFAEVTLQFSSGTFRPWTWTYADYRLESVIAFLNAAREDYRGRLARASASNDNESGEPRTE
jgi:hypothetical protein